MGWWPFANDSDWKALARVSYNAKNYKKAEPYLNKMIKRNPNDKWALDVLSRLYLNTSRHSNAIPLCIILVEKYSEQKHKRRLIDCCLTEKKFELIWHYLPTLELEKEDDHRLERVLKAYDSETWPTDFLSIFDEKSSFLAQLNASKMSGMGETAQAIEYLTDWLDKNDRQIPILMLLAFLNHNIGNVENTIKICDTVISEIGAHGSSHKLRIRAGVKIWEPEKLREELILAREILPNEIFFIRQAINLEMSEANDYKSALYLCEQGLEMIPGDRKLLCAKAQLLSNLGNHKDAMKAINILFSHHPLADECFLTRAQIMRAKGDGKGQVEAINEMLKINNFHPITSTGKNNEITIEHLQCDAPTYDKDHGKVSIIMTGYKKDPLLTVAVNSILAQTYKNIELIIVDDNSPDDSFEFLQNWGKDDERIKPFQMEVNGGTYLAKNFGITQATGRYLAFMDSDDWTHPQRIQSQVEKLIQYPAAQGVINDYFRIDENNNIPYRGNGSIRMACISLLLRKEAQEKIGFFDSLRVGADTEFIERLQAVYGESALIRDRIPSMFMTQHSSSLTGGGPFHISWRSIAGDRLQHHSAFREWHKKIKVGNSAGYISKNIHYRPFAAPENMKSKHYIWDETTPLFSQMIRQRNLDWWKGKKDVWQKHLSKKLKGEEFVAKYSIPIVPKILITDSYELNQFDQLTGDFVIKTSVGYSAKQVFPIKNGKNIFTGNDVTIAEILTSLKNDDFVQKQNHKIIVEKIVEDEFGYAIPLDYKFYMFGKTIAAIQVIDRPNKNQKEQTHYYYDENWNPIPINILPVRNNEDKFMKPKYFEEMKNAAMILGEKLELFMRIDFYSTKNGYYFGEFTPTPEGGNGFSEEGDQFLGSYWRYANEN